MRKTLPGCGGVRQGLDEERLLGPGGQEPRSRPDWGAGQDSTVKGRKGPRETSVIMIQPSERLVFRSLPLRSPR